jgi:protein SCO1
MVNSGFTVMPKHLQGRRSRKYKMSTKKNKKYLIGIAAAFGLPLFCYIVVSSLSKGAVKMPGHFIVDSVDVRTENGKRVADTFYHRVKDLKLTNQLGQEISTNTSLAGKILVVDFFFVSCPTICPRLTNNMAMLQNAFRHLRRKEINLDTVVQFISITVNPEGDSVSRLRAYADKHGANHDRWWFLTGDKKTIYDFARNELFVTATEGDGGPNDFIHTEKMVLIDKNREIRGYYNGLDTMSVKQCADDIVLLNMEREKKNR